MVEKRVLRDKGVPVSTLQPVALPKDYVSMVGPLLTQNFNSGLTALSKNGERAEFEVGGSIFHDEIILSVSVVCEKSLSATSIYASVDFDPTASSPKAEELMANCLDALGAFLGRFFDPKNKPGFKLFCQANMSEIEGIPFNWTKFEVNKRDVWIKVDKTNPRLDQMAEDFLQKNDPGFTQRAAKKEEESMEAIKDYIEVSDKMTKRKKSDDH